MVTKLRKVPMSKFWSRFEFIEFSLTINASLLVINYVFTINNVLSIIVERPINIIRFTYTDGISYSQYSLSKRTNSSLILIGTIMTNFSKECAPSVSLNFNHSQQRLYQSLLQWIRIQNFKIAVARERKQLLLLSDESLRDIGFSRSEANTEAFSHDLPKVRLDEIKNKKC